MMLLKVTVIECSFPGLLRLKSDIPRTKTETTINDNVKWWKILKNKVTSSPIKIKNSNIKAAIRSSVPKLAS